MTYEIAIVLGVLIVSLVLFISEVIRMDDSVEVALRRKRDSSMRVAITQVKPGEGGACAADACVCADRKGARLDMVGRSACRIT